MPPIRIVIASLVLIAGAAGPVAAHELWIAPEAYAIDPGGAIAADVRVGERFDGIRFPYVPKNFTRAEIVLDGEPKPLEGRIGDYPALRTEPLGPGLAVLVYETTAQHVTYSNREKFDAFVAYKGADWVLRAHRDRGLPETGFVETYRRFAKSLIAVGAGAGADRAVGMEIEIVALGNPYADAHGDGLAVQVLFEGRPLADSRLTVFAKQPPGTATESFFVTDALGRVHVALEPGTEYLLDCVVFRPVDLVAGGTGVTPVWETLWASLTFRVP